MRAFLPAALAALTLAACGDNGTTPPPGPAPVHSIAVSPADLTLAIGASTDIEVVLFDKDDNVLTGRTVTFTSDKPQVATANVNGRVTGVSVGTARITITSEGKSTWVDTEVAEVAPAVVAVELSHAATTLQVGEQLALGAVARDAEGRPVAGLPIQWSSDRPSVATVNATGVVEAFTAGVARITATIAGRSANVEVTVAVPPAPVISTWRVVGVGRGALDIELRSELLEQTETVTRRRITQLESGILTWNETTGAWSQVLVVRTYVRMDWQGNVTISELQRTTYDDEGTSRALSPVGWTEFTSTRAAGRAFNGYPYADGMETWQRFDPAIGPVHVQFARN